MNCAVMQNSQLGSPSGSGPSPTTEQSYTLNDLGAEEQAIGGNDPISGRSQTEHPQRRTFDNANDKSSSARKKRTTPKVVGNPEREFSFNQQLYKTYARGWPRLAAMQNNSDTVAIFRRFGFLFTRRIVHRQILLTAMEEELYELDKRLERLYPAALPPVPPLYSDFPEKFNAHDAPIPNDGLDTPQETIDALVRKRAKLEERIEKELVIYADLLDNHATLQELHKASNRQFKNVLRWMDSGNPLTPPTDHFILYQKDFISVAKQKNNKLVELVTEMFIFVTAIFDRKREDTKSSQTVESSPPNSAANTAAANNTMQSESEPPTPTSDNNTHRFDTDQIELISLILCVILSTSILMVPVFILFFTNPSHAVASVVVLVFSLLFAAAMTFATDGNMKEVFIGTCTYSAVLVVFLGNVFGNLTAGNGVAA